MHLILLSLVPLLLFVADLYCGIFSRLRPVAFFALLTVGVLLAGAISAGPANAQFINSTETLFQSTFPGAGWFVSAAFSGLKGFYLFFFSIYLLNVIRIEFQSKFNNRRS